MLVSLRIASSSSSSTVGNFFGSGLVRPRFRSCSHWAAQFSTRLCRLGIGDHPAHLRVENARLAQRSRLRGAHQLVVRHARPEEVGQARCQLDVADLVFGLLGVESVRRSAQRQRRRIPRGSGRSRRRGRIRPRLNAEQEIRRRPGSPQAPAGCLPRTCRLPSAPACTSRSFALLPASVDRAA